MRFICFINATTILMLAILPAAIECLFEAVDDEGRIGSLRTRRKSHQRQTQDEGRKDSTYSRYLLDDRASDRRSFQPEEDIRRPRTRAKDSLMDPPPPEIAPPPQLLQEEEAEVTPPQLLQEGSVRQADGQDSFDDNTEQARAERHDESPEERNVLGDSIFPFGAIAPDNNIFVRTRAAPTPDDQVGALSKEAENTKPSHHHYGSG